MAVTQYIGSRYVPLFADPIDWSDQNTYEPLTIVIHEGNSYTSRQAVPKGIAIDNEEFWALTGNYNAQVELYRRETAAAQTAADEAQNDIDTLLPKSAFTSDSTVKDYVDAATDDMQDLIDSLLSNSVASDYGTESFTGTEGNTSTVYWAIIPKTYKPKLRVANNQVDTVQYEIDAAHANKSAVQINAGIFNTSTGETHGPVIADGEILKETAYTGEDRNFIGMLNDGQLFTYRGQNVTGSSLKSAVNPIWACISFYSLIENGVFVATGRDHRDFEPRSIIAQDASGNYCLVCCGGRKYSDVGMSLWDVRDFLAHIGFVAQFAFNLDGGGSSSLCVNGIRVNGLVDDNHRAVANFLSFEEEKPYAELFDGNHAIANFLLENNKQVVSLYGSSYSQYVNKGANTARTITQVDKSTTDFAYTPTMREAVETSTGLYRILLRSANDTGLVVALAINPTYKVASLWGKNIITENTINYLSWATDRVPSTEYALESTTKSRKYIAIIETHGGQNQFLQLYPYNFSTTDWPGGCNFFTDNGHIGRIKFTFANNTVSYTVTFADEYTETVRLKRLIGVQEY